MFLRNILLLMMLFPRYLLIGELICLGTYLTKFHNLFSKIINWKNYCFSKVRTLSSSDLILVGVRPIWSTGRSNPETKLILVLTIMKKMEHDVQRTNVWKKNRDRRGNEGETNMSQILHMTPVKGSRENLSTFSHGCFLRDFSVFLRTRVMRVFEYISRVHPCGSLPVSHGSLWHGS